MNVTTIARIDSEVLIGLSDGTYAYLSQYSPGAISPATITQEGVDVTPELQEILGGGGGGASSSIPIVQSLTAWNQEFRVSSISSFTLPTPENEVAEKINITYIANSVSSITVTPSSGYTIAKLASPWVVSTGIFQFQNSISISFVAGRVYRIIFEVIDSSHIIANIYEFEASNIPPDIPGGQL